MANMMADALLAEALKAIGEFPDDSDRLVNYAYLLFNSGNSLLALQYAERAHSLAPKDFRAARFLSSVQAAEGLIEAAVASAEHAIVIAPTNTEIRIHLAGLLMRLEKPLAAIPHLLIATDGDEAPDHSWRVLSAALTELGRSERALEAIDRAIALSPQQTEYRVHRASLLMTRGRYEEALTELSQAVELAPENAGIWRTRSGLLEATGHLAEALSDAERAVALDPQNAELKLHLAHLSGSMGLAEGASQPDTVELAARTARWTEPVLTERSPPGPLATGFSDALHLQARVVMSLMLRDMRTRFGHSRLGYFWAVFEPIGHLLTLGTVFSFLNHGHPPLGTDLFVFYVSGLVPFLLFSHVTNDMMPVLTSNVSVLQLPIVKQIDVILAKGLLAFATEALVGIIVFSGFLLLGRPGMPADLLTCMIAFSAMWFLAMGIGMINLVVAQLFHVWEAIFSAILRLMYFASGIYYSPLMMPDWVREILKWNPVLQGVEWFRSGFYEQYDPHWLDRGYLVIWCIATLLLGFSLIRAMHKQLVVFG